MYILAWASPCSFKSIAFNLHYTLKHTKPCPQRTQGDFLFPQWLHFCGSYLKQIGVVQKPKPCSRAVPWTPTVSLWSHCSPQHRRFVCHTAHHHGFGKGLLLLPQWCRLQLCSQKVLVCGCAGVHELLSGLTMHFICLQAAFWWQKWSSSCRLYFCCKRFGVFTASFFFTLSTFRPSE